MKNLTFAIIIFSTLIAACAPASTSQPVGGLATLTASTTTATLVPTAGATPTLTPIPVNAPLPVHGFVVGDKAFQFLGANINKNWNPGSQAQDADLVKTARENGITVFQVDLPEIERPLGNFQEAELVKLDRFLDTASKNGIYVMIEFIHAWGIALDTNDPYYNPGGIEGLVKDSRLREAFKTRISTLIARVNTVNGSKYRDDPTILAWLLVQEILSAPENYTQGPPKVTIAELTAWVQEMAAYVKRLDPNHLVTLNTHSGLAKGGSGWLDTLSVPSLDFVEVEDGEARFAGVTKEPVDFYLQVFTLNKPVVMMISFTGGALDQKKICNDYAWQAQTLNQVFGTYYTKMGVAAGFVIFYWVSDLNTTNPDKCFAYSASNKVMAGAFQDIAAQLGPRDLTTVPLQFVMLRQPAPLSGNSLLSSATPLPTATLAPAATTVKPVNITAFCTLAGKDSKTRVPRGTPISITWGWDAKTETQVNDYILNNITTITLDGIALEGIMSSGIVTSQTSGLPAVTWHSEVGVLDPGQHTLAYDVNWKKMIDDGTNTYGPGSKNETVHDECQIIVE